MLGVFAGERLFMISEPRLEVCGAPHIFLPHTPLRQVHNVGRKALALERASIGLQLPHGAVAVGQHRLLQWDRELFEC